MESVNSVIMTLGNNLVKSRMLYVLELCGKVDIKLFMYL